MVMKSNISWETFPQHLHNMMREMYEKDKYPDVSLISDDQIQFKAHKIVLSACSTVLQKIIDSNPGQHPLIYLRGIRSNELESILQFMYLGEARLYRERMQEFIKIAQDLKVNEISDGVELPSEEIGETVEENIPEEEIEEELIEETLIKAEESKVRPRRQRTKISNDKKSTQCPECGKVYVQRQHMLAHFRSKHEGFRYPCNHCDYQATQQSNLQTHIRSVHERIKYPCNQCGYQASYRSDLQRHIQSVHEGVKYPCNQCDYQATKQNQLQAHISAKHSDTVHKCEYCDFQTKWRSSYNTHIRSHLSDFE